MIMKKYATCLMILLVMQFLQGSDNKTMVRWGDDKELAVAWYLFKNPKGKNDQESMGIKDWHKKNSNNNVVRYLEKLELLTLFMTGAGKDVNSYLLKIWLSNEKFAIRTQFITKKTNEFEFYIKNCDRLGEFNQLFKENVNELIKKDIAVLCVNKNNNIFDFTNYIKLSKDKFVAKHKDIIVQVNKELYDNICNALNIVQIQEDCINNLDINNFLINSFATMLTDRFFDFNDKSYIGKSHIINLDIKEKFEKDIISFLYNQLVYKKEKTTENYDGFDDDFFAKIRIGDEIKIDDTHCVKYFRHFYSDYFTEINLNGQCEKSDALFRMLNDIKFFKAKQQELDKNTKDKIIYSMLSLFHLALIIKNCNIKKYFGENKFIGIDLDLNVLDKLNDIQKEFIYKLQKSTEKESTLIKFTPQLAQEWFKYPELITQNKNLQGLNIDIDESKPSNFKMSITRTFIDNMIIHLPLLVNTFMPDFLFYLSRHTGLGLISGIALSEFLGSFPILSLINILLPVSRIHKVRQYIPKNYPSSSYSLGAYVFPWLDRTFSSHIPLLKTFFGADKVRTNIRRDLSFMMHSAAHWILSFVGNILSRFNQDLGVFIYCIRISIYYFMFDHVRFKNPIDRGAPRTEQFFAQQNPYTLGDLVRPSKVS